MGGLTAARAAGGTGCSDGAPGAAYFVLQHAEKPTSAAGRPQNRGGGQRCRRPKMLQRKCLNSSHLRCS